MAKKVIKYIGDYLENNDEPPNVDTIHEKYPQINKKQIRSIAKDYYENELEMDIDPDESQTVPTDKAWSNIDVLLKRIKQMLVPYRHRYSVFATAD